MIEYGGNKCTQAKAFLQMCYKAMVFIGHGLRFICNSQGYPYCLISLCKTAEPEPPTCWFYLLEIMQSPAQRYLNIT